MADEANGAAMITWSYGGISGVDVESPSTERIHFVDDETVVLRSPVTYAKGNDV
jgi:hypothetical protein